MGSCAGALKRKPKAEKGSELDGVVQWYRPCTAESQHWMNLKKGFGYGRKRSFRQCAQPNPQANRNGNRDGELAGKVIFYKRANADTNYSYLPENPVVTLKEGDHLYAKAFLDVPLNRIPVGENNLRAADMDTLHGRGATLLASKPRLIALFIDVDGEPQAREHFCKASAQEAMRCYSREERVTPHLPRQAVAGSFMTFCVAREQEPYFFIHLPLIGTLLDTHMATGHYGETLIRAYCELLQGLAPGTHTIDFRLYYWYDHLEYDYYVIHKGPNPLGKWRTNLENGSLKTPHPKPRVLVGSDGPIARGSCTVFLAEKFDNLTNNLLDMKPPPEVYSGSDTEHIRKVARVVAAGQFCETMGLNGLPDWVVLSSPMIEKTRTEPSSLLPVKPQKTASHSVLDFAALWLNEQDPRPEAAGVLVEGSMAKGDISPDVSTDEWIYIPSSRNGVNIAPRKWPVKNKYINICRKGRRFSIISPHRGSMSLAAWTRAHNLMGDREQTISESPEMR